LFNGLLSLFFRPHKQHFAAFAHRGAQKITRGFQLIDGLAQINDVDSVAGIKDERLHLGVPPFGLVSKMHPGVQQFFNSDRDHSFPLVKSRPCGPAIPRNTGLIYMSLWPPAPSGTGI